MYRLISDINRSWCQTRGEGFSHPPERLDPANTGSPAPRHTLPKNTRIQFLNGPQAVRYDNFRFRGWYLATHSGAWTPPHHDANGLMTWVYFHEGVKFWVLMRPKTSLTREEYVEWFGGVTSSPGYGRWRELSEFHVIRAKPGTLLQVLASLLCDPC